MKQIVLCFLAIFAGALIGSVANMLIISFSTTIIPLPKRADNSSIKSLEQTIHLFQFKHFIMPFLAHSVGSLIGGTIAAWIAPRNKLLVALTIGSFFFIGGAMIVFQLPSPIWFNIIDLTLAYLPMSWIGYRIHLIYIKN